MGFVGRGGKSWEKTGYGGPDSQRGSLWVHWPFIRIIHSIKGIPDKNQFNRKTWRGFSIVQVIIKFVRRAQR